MTKWIRLGLAVVALTTALAGCATALKGAATTPVATGVRARLAQDARRLAAQNGDPHPTAAVAVWASDHRHAEFVVSIGDVVNDRPHDPVYVVEVRGRFRCGICSVPPGAALPTGDVLDFTIEAGTFAVEDFGIANRWVPLARLGTPFGLLSAA